MASVNRLIITSVKFESKSLKNAINQRESIRISISIAEELVNFQMIRVLAENKAGTNKPTEINGFWVKIFLKIRGDQSNLQLLKIFRTRLYQSYPLLGWNQIKRELTWVN